MCVYVCVCVCVCVCVYVVCIHIYMCVCVYIYVCVCVSVCVCVYIYMHICRARAHTCCIHVCHMRRRIHVCHMRRRILCIYAVHGHTCVAGGVKRDLLQCQKRPTYTHVLQAECSRRAGRTAHLSLSLHQQAKRCSSCVPNVFLMCS